MAEAWDCFRADDVARVLQLVSDIAAARRMTPASVIEWFADLHGERRPAKVRLDTHTVEFVERMRSIRLSRNAAAGASLFKDVAWDMLLELFCAYHQNRELTVSAVSLGSGAPLSTALRQLARLEDLGLVHRDVDRADMRRCKVIATQKGVDLVGSTVAELIDSFISIQHNWVISG